MADADCIRSCRSCGGAFAVARERRTYCSAPCKKAAKAVRRKVRGYGPQKQRRRQAVCIACKSPFVSVPNGKSQSGWTQCCSRQCGLKVANRTKHLRAGTVPSWLYPVVVTTYHGHCAVCTKHYRKNAKVQLYCGHACQMVSVGRYAPTEKTCTECGSSFIADRWQRTCGDECKARLEARHKRIGRSKRRHRLRGQKADSIDPIRVFERDNWRCHLCHKLTLKDKRGTCHERAPELDHVVTLADGGSHTWGNVACACRKCNGAKGARSMGQLGLGLAA